MFLEKADPSRQEQLRYESQEHLWNPRDNPGPSAHHGPIPIPVSVLTKRSKEGVK